MAQMVGVITFFLGSSARFASGSGTPDVPSWRGVFQRDAVSVTDRGAIVLVQSSIGKQHTAFAPEEDEWANGGSGRVDLDQDININSDMFWSERAPDSGVQLPQVDVNSKLFLRTETSVAVPLAKAMHRLTMTDPSVCLTIQGKGVGGVANTVSLINTVLDFAIVEKLRFKKPSLYIPAHNIGDSFTNLFGETKNCSSPVLFYNAFCDSAQGVIYKNGKLRCSMNQFMLDVSSSSLQTSRLCSCNKVVVLNTSEIHYHFNYSRTRNKLATWYWGAHSLLARLPNSDVVEPGSRRRTALSIVVHVRLGDVADNGFSEKHKAPSMYLSVMQALYDQFANMSDCIHTAIVTDGRKSDKDIAYILSQLTRSGIPTPMVYDVDTVDAVAAFEIMTHADVLVCGGSGFSRLAALMVRDTSVVLGSELKSHPLGYLPNFINLPHGLGGGSYAGISSTVTVASIKSVLVESKGFKLMKRKAEECMARTSLRSIIDQDIATLTASKTATAVDELGLMA